MRTISWLSYVFLAAMLLQLVITLNWLKNALGVTGHRIVTNTHWKMPNES
jgi:hypothetical protein